MTGQISLCALQSRYYACVLMSVLMHGAWLVQIYTRYVTASYYKQGTQNSTGYHNLSSHDGVRPERSMMR